MGSFQVYMMRSVEFAATTGEEKPRTNALNCTLVPAELVVKRQQQICFNPL
ncbi:Hypothetical predicted protein, partial [Podarcis lilfordi]